MFIGDDEARLGGRYKPGSVKVFNTTALGRNDVIPWAQPYATKLFGLGLETLASQPCDLIVGWYFEPYGLVAAQLAQALGCPFILRHAGSDIGRLIKHQNLGPAYRWALSLASKILTTAQTAPLLVDMGARESACHVTRGSAIPRYFMGRIPKLDLPVIVSAAEPWYEKMGLDGTATDVLHQGLGNHARLLSGLPVIGVYGKVGRSKGSYDLLDTLEGMLADGDDFEFLAISGGQPAVFQAYLHHLASKSRLRERAVTLPFMAQWRIPGFLRACDLVCFLERDFAITFHAPKVATEVLASGTALVCSGEIADKQYYSESLVPGKNYLRVDDPKNHDSLRDVLAYGLRHERERRDMAIHGRLLARHLDNTATATDGYADAIEQSLMEIFG
jgi:glycosyltransferase involved in cell wall biosynthesis